MDVHFCFFCIRVHNYLFIIIILFSMKECKQAKNINR